MKFYWLNLSNLLRFEDGGYSVVSHSFLRAALGLSLDWPIQLFNCERQNLTFGDGESKFLFNAKAVSPIRKAWPLLIPVPTMTGFDQVSAPGKPEMGQAA